MCRLLGGDCPSSLATRDRGDQESERYAVGLASTSSHVDETGSFSIHQHDESFSDCNPNVLLAVMVLLRGGNGNPERSYGSRGDSFVKPRFDAMHLDNAVGWEVGGEASHATNANARSK